MLGWIMRRCATNRLPEQDNLCAAMQKILIVFMLCTGISKTTVAGPLFLESFDGPGLPASLDYISDPAFNQWAINSSQQLLGEKILGGGGNIQAAISKDSFVLPGGGLTFSADMGRPVGTVPGGSNIGLVFGDYVALFHPGYPNHQIGGDLGAFRLIEGLFSRNTLINNTDMGFIPALESLHHVEARVAMQGTTWQ